MIPFPSPLSSLSPLRTLTVLLLLVWLVHSSYPQIHSLDNINHNDLHHGSLPSLSPLDNDIDILSSPIPLSTSIGSPPLLIILVDFPSTPSQFTPADFYSQFISSPHSFINYYSTVSHSLLNYSVPHTSPLNAIVGDGPLGGPFSSALRLPYDKEYYSGHAHGYNVSSCPRCILSIATHALSILDERWGGNFSLYTNGQQNNNKIQSSSKTSQNKSMNIDSVIIIYAGGVYDESKGGAYNYRQNKEKKNIKTNNKIPIDQNANQNELLPTAHSMSDLPSSIIEDEDLPHYDEHHHIIPHRHGDHHDDSHSHSHHGHGPYVSSQGYTFSSVTFCEELHDDHISISGGTRCIHEKAHTFSLPDLYDFDYQTTGGVGYYDALAQGTFSGKKDLWPVEFSSHTKWQLGWVKYREIRVENYSVIRIKIPLIQLTPQAIKIIPPPVTHSSSYPYPHEYFLLEHRGHIGEFDSQFNILWSSSPSPCPLGGLLIWHVDDGISSQRWGGKYYKDNRVNTIKGASCHIHTENAMHHDHGKCPSHRGLTLVEADGRDDMRDGKSRGGCEKILQIGGSADGQWESMRMYNGESSGILRIRAVKLCRGKGDMIVEIERMEGVGREGKEKLEEDCDGEDEHHNNGNGSETLKVVPTDPISPADRKSEEKHKNHGDDKIHHNNIIRRFLPKVKDAQMKIEEGVM